MNIQDYTIEAVELLKRLIATPSISRDEKAAADEMGRFLTENGLSYQREGNNIWMLSPDFSLLKPTLLLNAHIDTVKPAKSWSRDPFKPTIEGDRLYGLGSNDCGGGLVSLLQVYRILASNSVNAKYNYVYLASCEEEISGENGFSRVLPLLPKIDVAIVGEPTGMQPAVAEKGLMVLDLIATVKSGHAAREEGVNAIYQVSAKVNAEEKEAVHFIVENGEWSVKLGEYLGQEKIDGELAFSSMEKMNAFGSEERERESNTTTVS